MNIPVITRDALEGYLNCKYLAHLRLGGHQDTKSEYEKALLQARLEQELAATNKLRSLYDQQITATGNKLTRDKLREGASFILDVELQDDFPGPLRWIKKGGGPLGLGYVSLRTDASLWGVQSPQKGSATA